MALPRVKGLSSVRAYIVCPFEFRIGHIVLTVGSLDDLVATEHLNSDMAHLYKDEDGHMPSIVGAIATQPIIPPIDDHIDVQIASTEMVLDSMECSHLTPSNVIYHADELACNLFADDIMESRGIAYPRYAWALDYSQMFAYLRPSNLPQTIYGRAIIVGKGEGGNLVEPSFDLMHLQKHVYWGWEIDKLIPSLRNTGATMLDEIRAPASMRAANAAASSEQKAESRQRTAGQGLSALANHPLAKRT